MPDLRVLKVLRHIIKADGLKAARTVAIMSQARGSAPYLLWLDPGDVAALMVKLPAKEAAAMIDGISAKRAAEIVDIVG